MKFEYFYNVHEFFQKNAENRLRNIFPTQRLMQIPSRAKFANRANLMPHSQRIELSEAVEDT